MTADLTLRRGVPGDEGAVLGLFDRAVEWLVSQGFTGQWGEQPWSGQPRRRALAAEWCGGDGAWFAEADGTPVGFLGVGEAIDHVPPAEVPELYVRALVTCREPAARGAGRVLLEHAVALARQQGVEQVRVDCYAGNGGRLVAFYESCGFTRVGGFTVGETWAGALLTRPTAVRHWMR
ncbi:GNAT family N-acetyltransferase [Nocardioides sp. GXQ0305]|uniref:GNAT family N-acetyltransferase n=1 Tax=Nocardioides sp. GXQ0305 TaxID=3423912 RepID=UPI003D7D1FAE